MMKTLIALSLAFCLAYTCGGNSIVLVDGDDPSPPPSPPHSHSTPDQHTTTPPSDPNPTGTKKADISVPNDVRDKPNHLPHHGDDSPTHPQHVMGVSMADTDIALSPSTAQERGSASPTSKSGDGEGGEWDPESADALATATQLLDQLNKQLLDLGDQLERAELLHRNLAVLKAALQARVPLPNLMDEPSSDDASGESGFDLGRALEEGELEVALEELEELVHHHDNGVDFFGLGGAAALVACVKEELAPAQALWVLGSAVQNNAPAQQSALDAGILDAILPILTSSLAQEGGGMSKEELCGKRMAGDSVVKKAIYALGSLLRGSPDAQRRALEESDLGPILFSAGEHIVDVCGQGGVLETSMAGKLMSLVEDLGADDGGAPSVWVATSSPESRATACAISNTLFAPFCAHRV